MELVEQSLDINLFGNNIKYKFVDTPILDGVSAYESEETVVILVPTVCSIHKLTFPHPSQLHKQVISFHAAAVYYTKLDTISG